MIKRDDQRVWKRKTYPANKCIEKWRRRRRKQWRRRKRLGDKIKKEHKSLKGWIEKIYFSLSLYLSFSFPSPSLSLSQPLLIPPNLLVYVCIVYNCHCQWHKPSYYAHKEDGNRQNNLRRLPTQRNQQLLHPLLALNVYRIFLHRLQITRMCLWVINIWWLALHTPVSIPVSIIVFWWLALRILLTLLLTLLLILLL